jgi:hypothetical protein
MNYIDTSKVLQMTDNGLSVFRYYFQSEDLTNPKHKFSIRPEEKTPSARVYWFGNQWLITDFGNRGEVNGMSAISFVMWKEGVMYYDALRFIQDVIVGRSMAADSFRKPEYKPRYEMREMGPDDKKGKYNFTYKTVATDSDLLVFGRYTTREVLEKFNCKPIEKYEYCAGSKKLNRDVVHIFWATDDYPMFVFDYGEFKKLYRPYDPEKKNRFIYVGDKPTYYIYGLKQLVSAKNEFVGQDESEDSIPKEKPTAIVKDVFRVSGESDAINLASLGFHVYWLNSESENYRDNDFKRIDDLCENHYQVFDIDDTGKKYAAINAIKHMNINTVFLPEWLSAKRDWRGNACKDVKDFCQVAGSNEEETRMEFIRLKQKAKTIKFWFATEDKKGSVSYNISLEHYYYFLNMHGFWVTDSKYHSKAGYCYAKVEDKIVHLISPDDIKKVAKRFTKEWIRSKNLMYEIQLLNKINSSNQINESNLQEIPEIEFNFKNHDAKSEYLHFKNGSIKITKTDIEKVKHEQVPNFILGSLDVNGNKISHLIDHNIYFIKNPLLEVKASDEYAKLLVALENEKDTGKREELNIQVANFEELDRYTLTIYDKEFIFIRFLRDLSHIHWRKELEEKVELTDKERKEQDLLFINILFFLGYNCSQYKDRGKPWLSLLQDMKISQVGQSSGRSGKSLLTIAFGLVRPSFYVGGRKLTNSQIYQFIYDGYTKFHNNIEIDDFAEYGDFDFFYTQVTGKREINKKHLAQEVLDYPDSGKMIISTNFELQKTDNSTIARILNTGVSDYYHEKTKYNDYKESRSPLSKYGRRMYDDFTDEEWVKFYNIIAYCVQMQMNFFKIQPPMDNLDKRQLRREMTRGLGKDEEFMSWARDYFVLGSTAELTDETAGVKISTAEHGYLNTFIIKDKAYQHFTDTLSDVQGKKYKATQFKKAVIAYCEYMEWMYNPESLCSGQYDTSPESRRIIKTIDGKSTECFYITKMADSAELPVLSDDEKEGFPF